ncbi:hypothetical protein [Streptomyces sp. NBRC 110028]|uniref:hypothetical protein n=1 Tax=Streptomyces sp. NBRC 110028 TaxID=1621260 RepID=UPI000A600F61|nr:hypothetical protein [Streptomyces sp. NBRC 110028]
MPFPASHPLGRAARHPGWPRRLLAFVLCALLLTAPGCLGHAAGAEHAQGLRIADDSRQLPVAGTARQFPVAGTAGQPSTDGPAGAEHCAPAPRETSGRAAHPSVRDLPVSAAAEACRAVVSAAGPDRPRTLCPRAPTVRSTLCSTSRWRI